MDFVKASAWEFKARFWIILAIYTVGFVAPWDFWWQVDGAGPNAHVWGRLAVLLSCNGAMTTAAAFNLALVAAIGFAAAGAWLRIWGSAYLGVDVMQDTSLRGDGMVADGPYRFLRNPLYVGAWLNLLALALLMPPSGAVFTLVTMIGFQMRLIFGEEAFLREKLGAPYAAYCAKVPRIVPAMWPQVAGSGARAQWGQAALAEVFMWGSAASFAVLGWRYDARLLMQCVLVWLGVALVVKGLGGRMKWARK
jgi:protein-S-isoprenylcysteine O-methyltransferase Ste14